MLVMIRAPEDHREIVPLGMVYRRYGGIGLSSVEAGNQPWLLSVSCPASISKKGRKSFSGFFIPCRLYLSFIMPLPYSTRIFSR